MFFSSPKKVRMPSPDQALPGRSEVMPVPEQHFVLKTPLKGPFAAPYEAAVFGMGCFWGAERKFWEADGVHTTSVGYAAGYTPNPTYREVCSGQTGHNEVVMVVFDTSKTSFDAMLKVFWENHDPTQGMRQGNDVGTQYRSGIYTYTAEQKSAAIASKAAFADKLKAAGKVPFPAAVADLERNVVDEASVGAGPSGANAEAQAEYHRAGAEVPALDGSVEHEALVR
ncbi:MAG: peptide-methionine (S)-S-oxide reductase MsrA, partial [Planctomycetota bacterium]